MEPAPKPSQPCEECKGTGKIKVPWPTHQPITLQCGRCKGTGKARE